MSMDTKKSAVVILAAGVGSRMSGIDQNISKCAVDLGGTTPLQHTIKVFSKNYINSFIIVVGSKKESIIKSISHLKEDINFVENHFYDFHGCEYSLSCSYQLIKNYDEIFITEGDLLLDEINVRQIINKPYKNSVLLRHKDNINPFRSVVAIGDIKQNSVTKFVYDAKHNNIYDMINDKTKILGESAQVWRFGGQSLALFQKNLEQYFKSCSENEKRTESGIYTINKTILENPMTAVFTQNNNWLNLNTENDIIEGKRLKWLEK